MPCPLFSSVGRARYIVPFQPFHFRPLRDSNVALPFQGSILVWRMPGIGKEARLTATQLSSPPHRSASSDSDLLLRAP